MDGPQGRPGQVRIISSPTGFDPRTVQPVASRYTDCSTRPQRTPRSPKKSDIYQKSYWYNWLFWWWALGCSKHVENWNKYKEKNCASSWLSTKTVIRCLEGRRPLWRPRRRWVDNRMDLQEVRCGYMDWIGLAQDRDRWRTLVSAVMNLRVPWNAGNFLTGCKPVSFSWRTLQHAVSNNMHGQQNIK